MFPKPEGRKRDREYLGAVHDLGCVLRDADDDPTRGPKEQAGPCAGRLEANHAGERPLGRKSDDDTAIPMCQKHHQQWTDYTGFFSRRSVEWRRAWAADRISEVRSLVALRRTGLHVVAVPW